MMRGLALTLLVMALVLLAAAAEMKEAMPLQAGVLTGLTVLLLVTTAVLVGNEKPEQTSAKDCGPPSRKGSQRPPIQTMQEGSPPTVTLPVRTVPQLVQSLQSLPPQEALQMLTQATEVLKERVSRETGRPSGPTTSS